MSTDDTYEGWTNRETWCVKLWIDNDQGTHEYWRDQVRFLLSEEGQAAHRDRWFGMHKDSPKLVAAFALEEQLKEEIEEEASEIMETPSLLADLLSGAYARVNWREIAQTMVTDMIEDMRSAKT